MVNFDDYKRNRINLIKENDYLNNFINTNKLDDNFISNHFSLFNDCLSSLQMCKNCPGLNACAQKTKGERKVLSYDSILDIALQRCDYYLKQDNIDKHFNSFVYNDMPKIYCTLDMSNINVEYKELKPLFTKCYEILENNSNKGLFIYGDMGVGKTYMCYALANSLVKKNKKVAFIKVNNFVTSMASMLVSEFIEYKNIVNKISKCDYVFFDDIGSESVSEFSRDRLLFNILDYRMENKLCTFFTSNLDKENLLKYYSHNQDNGINSKRIIERIKILTDDYCLIGKDKRGIEND